jgi:O-antigen ligase/tetratricopeptide (TPR) repeat protein
MVSAKVKKKKQQPQNKPKIKEQGSHDWLHQIAFWGLVLLLFFPPYFRGLFFAPEQEKALILAALVFWVTFFWRWLQRDHKFLATPLDWFALALPVVYILSTFVAVNKGLAIQEVVKNILYFLTFWSVSRLVRHEKDAENILKVIYISAVGVALAGLATTTGIINIKDGFLEGRIYSTFQYPNALAAYLGAVIFMGTYLWNRALDNHREALETARENIWIKLDRLNLWGYLLSCGNFLLFTVLLGTKSRAGLLVFALVLVIYLTGIGAQRRLSSALHLACLGVIAFVVINRFIPLAQDGYSGQAWVWVLGGLLLAAAGQAVLNLLDQKVLTGLQANGKKAVLAFGALALVVVLAAGMWLSANPQVMEKVTDVKYLRTGFQRVYYINFAVDMIKERPLMGWGGGGWQEAYRSFMDYRYTTRQVHSHYFQVGVETGIPGLLATAGLMLSFLYLAHRLYHGSRDNPARRQLTWTLTIAFLMIAGHAMIDFDLSLSALALVLWSSFGVIGALRRGEQVTSNEGNEQPRKKTAVPRWTSPAITSILIVVILLGVFSLAQARTLMGQGVSLANSNQANRGLQYMEKALSYNPFNAGYRITLSQLFIALKDEEKAVEQALNAVALSPYDTNPRNNLTHIAISAGDYELAARAAEEAVGLAPNELSVYEHLAQTYTRLGMLELEAGNKESARDYFTKSKQVPKQMMQYWESIDETGLAMWTGPKLQVTRKMHLATGEASYWLGDLEGAEKSLREAEKDEGLKAEALMYQALVKEKQGEQQRVNTLLKQVINLSPDLERTYASLNRVPIINK